MLLSNIKKAALGGLLAIVLLAGNTSFAATISRGYRANEPLPEGTIVSLARSGSTEEIEKANLDNQDLLTGVIIGQSGSVVNYAPAGTDVKVATEGSTQLLVSTANGDIKQGDILIVSPLSGVAMKYTDSISGRYIALAQEDFSSSHASAKQTSVQTLNGESDDLYVGIISSNLVINQESALNQEETENIFTAAAARLAGRPVNMARVLISGSIFMASVLVTGLLLQGSVRGTFISLGRNPLSRDSLLPALARVVLLAVVIIFTGITAAYMILAV